MTENSRPPFFARTVRKLSPLIIVGWLAVTLILTLASVGGDWSAAIPSLERVAEKNAVSLMPKDAPSALAMKRIGHNFGESDSDSSAMIVLEGQQPLGDDAHRYYGELIAALRDDPKHVEHVQDLWGDRLTASSVTSPDGKATYVQLNLAGDQGTPQGDESVAAVRDIVDRSSPPACVEVYVTGAAPLASDMQHSGNRSILKITAVTVVIIFILLFLVYRSVVTVILLLIMVGVELAAARAIVAFLGANEVFVLSTFAVNMLVFLAIAAGTDYGIFFFGRYQEARQAGEDREQAYYSMYRGVTPVVLASGLTIAGAILCLTFTRLPYFETMGIPCAIGMAAAVAVAVTLVPAGIAVGSRFGLLEPKRALRVRRWRGIGTAVVRWPVPICWSLRSIFDAMDGVDKLDDNLQIMVENMDELDAIMPKLLVQFPQMIAIMKTMRVSTLTMHTTMSGLMAQMDETSKDAAVMGQTFDAAKNDDSFFLPPEVFQNPDFQKAMKSFISPDGRSVRFIISHNGDPQSPEGIERVEQIRTAAEEALKGTPLASGKIYIAGAAATAKDWQEGSKYDLWIAGIAAICLVFLIMLFITRSFIAALVIVGTVVLSLGASFGLSVLLWQYILGIHLHWMVLAMSVIILLAVGSDYNLLLVSRMKEEIGAGINTGIIRAMGGTGKVVTTAGVVFACTMAAMAVSDLQIIGQIGTTIGLGLLFDTMIVRSFMTPSIAALLGRWFWWPQRVRPRPASVMLRPHGPRPAVRSLLSPGPDAATQPIRMPD
ncbi:putative membrane protein MmpL [Mycolicibacterium farcinogenes]|uniref:Transport protein n=1 Tax=Mycolicibacterium senegalense TaxID=1796 RepID=A0A378W7V2_9MYCO|nr:MULTISPECIES: MMPL family transporter [Mycolicibacterium]CDP87218.1 putative membrane protein MmpL [Mycolicibacterium farcinogenes]SUA28879.1 Transport protein [Mycolicibacterium senegalense]